MAKNALQKYGTPMITRGIIGILFALLLLFWTKEVLEVLVFIFGFFVLLDGIVSIIGAFGAKGEHEEWWIYLLRGIIGIIVGVLIFTWPGVTALVLIYFIAIWTILMGAFELWLSSKILKDTAGKGILTVVGIVSIVIGLFFVIAPYSSIITVTWLIGLFVLISGISLIVFGTQIKNLK